MMVMKKSKITTSELFIIKQASQLSGLHPSTIRLYEKIKAIPAILRAGNNYRMFSGTNILQIKIAWLAFRFTWLSGHIQKTALSVISHSVNADFKKALSETVVLTQRIEDELRESKNAVRLAQQWAHGKNITRRALQPMGIKEAAAFTGTTPDALRNWERNGLFKPGRNEQNRYRVYFQDDIDRIIITRTLKKARYSAMSILRMFMSISKGKKKNLARIIDTPDEDDICYATDKWVTTLKDLKKKSATLYGLVKSADKAE
jgi:DNA-binding transcriptional MerR regulator